jgi:hypothetical protein
MPGSRSPLIALEAAVVNEDPGNLMAKIASNAVIKNRADGAAPNNVPMNANSIAYWVSAQSGTGFERGLVFGRNALLAVGKRPAAIDLDLPDEASANRPDPDPPRCRAALRPVDAIGSAHRSPAATATALVEPFVAASRAQAPSGHGRGAGVNWIVVDNTSAAPGQGSSSGSHGGPAEAGFQRKRGCFDHVPGDRCDHERGRERQREQGRRCDVGRKADDRLLDRKRVDVEPVRVVGHAREPAAAQGMVRETITT